MKIMISIVSVCVSMCCSVCFVGCLVVQGEAEKVCDVEKNSRTAHFILHRQYALDTCTQKRHMWACIFFHSKRNEEDVS